MQILQVSIYVSIADFPNRTFGRRSTVYSGVPNLEELVASESQWGYRIFKESELVTDTRSGESTSTIQPGEIELMTLRYPGSIDQLRPASGMPRSMFEPDSPNKLRKRPMPEQGSTTPPTERKRGHESQDKLLILGESTPPDRFHQAEHTCPVSGFPKTCDTLRGLTRKHLDENLQLVELNFQPFKR